MKKLKLKLILVSLIGFTIFTSLPLYGISTGIDDILVGSDIRTNSYLKLEMYLYKADDQDPNYDYYLVALNMFEYAYRNDISVEIWDIHTYIKCYASFGDVVCLESFREPDPGVRVLETPGSVEFYGVGLDIWLPVGAINFWYGGEGEHEPWWRVGAVMNYAGIIPATRGEADFTIGFRVSQGAHVYIYGNCRAVWYRWLLFWIVYVTSGWGSECYIYH